MEPGGGQSATQCAEASCLEKEQIDQDNDRHPRHRVPEDDSVSEPAVRPQSVVRHQRTAVQRFGHHERLPGSVPRGGRLANRCRLCFLPKSYFFGSLCDHRISPARLDYSVVRTVAGRFSFDEQSCSKQRRNGHLLPVQRRCVVQ
jgi:hypothetical protein